MRNIPITLADAFSRRKQIESELVSWIKRLGLAGRDSVIYQTKKIEGENSFKPIPGTLKNYNRTYTVEECRKKINELIQADKELALRISLTNQKAKAEMLDLDGKEVELTIPELIVLKNDIAPKLEEAARAIPKLANGVNFLEVTDNYKKWRSVQPYYKQKQSLSEKGHKIEEDYIDYYDVNEVTDYGIEERNVFDEIDRIHEWQHRLKEAINKANRYELVDL